MSMDIKTYGKVYKHITDAINRNFGQHTLPWKFDDLKCDLRRTKEKECEDGTYPEELHEALSDMVLRWCFHGFKGTGKEEIYKIFIQLWKFHKRWLLRAAEHTAGEIIPLMDQEAANEISGLCSDDPDSKYHDLRMDCITGLYEAVMESVVGEAKEDNVDGKAGR